MNLPFTLPSTDTLLWIAAGLVALVVVWVVLRFVLELAIKIFAIGCALIVALAVGLAFLYLLGIVG